MRNLLAILLMGLVALSGCVDNDDAPETDETDNTDMAEEPAAPTEEDLGEYILELATGHCHAKDYVETPSGTYQSDFGGGTWVMQETNGIPGLQYEDNHPGSDSGTVFGLAVDSRCTDGDQVVA